MNELLAESGLQNQGPELCSEVLSWAPDWTRPPKMIFAESFYGVA